MRFVLSCAMVSPLNHYANHAMTEIQAPSIARRLGASIYEFTLLFGIYFVTGAGVQTAYTLMGQTAPIWVIQLVIFMVFGWYLAHSWQKVGQTLAQKTWHIQILSQSGSLPSAKQAWLRYVASYLGILPALLMALTSLHPNPSAPILNHDNLSVFFVQTIVFITANWLALLGTSLMNPQRRAIHEIISGTRSAYVPPSKAAQ